MNYYSDAAQNTVPEYPSYGHSENAVDPYLNGLPIYLYGNSYTTLDNTYFTAGKHYSQLLAAKLGGGPVTSYGVGNQRIMHGCYSLLEGVVPATTAATVAGSKWPGTSSRKGLVIFDYALADIAHAPAMNVAPVLTAITTANTRYIDGLKGMYRLALALASSESRNEQAAASFAGTWASQALAGAPFSGGSLAYSTTVGASVTHTVTPAQYGPLAGKVFLLNNKLDPSLGVAAQMAISVDGGAAVNYTPTAWEQYVGANGAQVNQAHDCVAITVPADGAAHTVAITHAGSAGQVLYDDALIIPSNEPNPIAVMGAEKGPNIQGGNDAQVNAYRFNQTLVTPVLKSIVAEFPNAFYVPSTITDNGLYSLDGAHPNDRGQAQRMADLEYAMTPAIRARMATRALSLANNFNVI